MRSIVGCVCDTLDALKARYPHINTELSRDVKFITTQELLDLYPDMTPKEREAAITREYKTVFLMQIGGKLSDGNHMTAAHRTTTIGRLTGISCSISHCWTARLKFRLWESG